MNDRLLIIPDSHVLWERTQTIIDYQSHDRLIHLGDVFDCWDDNPEMNRRMAIWLKESLANPTHIHLVGNHDHAYRFPYNDAAYCSGYAKEKALRINEILNRDDWAKLKYYHYEQGILFSHAGLSTRFLNQERAPKKMPGLLEWLDLEIPRAIDATERREMTSLFGAGYSRGGRYPTGGIIWSDHDIDGMPLEVPQIVGHTPHPQPDLLIRRDGKPRLEHLILQDADPTLLLSHWWQLDLDTHLNHYAMIEDGMLTVHEIAWKQGEGINKLDEISYTFERFSGKLPISP